MIPETAITIGKFIVVEYDDGYEEIVPVLSVPYTVSAKEALELLKVYGVDDLYPGTARFEVFSTAFNEGQIVWMDQVRREATKEEEEECAVGIQQRYGCDIYKIIRAYKK